MYFGNLQYRSSRSRAQAGYMLIVIIFMVVGLTIAILATAPKIAQQIKRDRETEMIHRGVEYSRAIKKYYKKFNRYPPTLEALEDTNHLRFLRKRYKDPLVADGKWQLVRFGQVQFNAGQPGQPGQQGGGFTNNGQPGLPNVPGVTGALQGSPIGQPGGGITGQPTSQFGSTGSTTGSTDSSTGTSTGLTTNQPTSQSSSGFSLGQSTTGTGTLGGGAIGGGAIIGVASLSPQESLRVVDDKNHYKDWKFVYDPTLDRTNALINGPYDPKKAMGSFGSSGIGKQIGQPIGSQQQGTGFGQSSFGQSSFGQSSFGQQTPQQMPTPYHPPDQIQQPTPQ